MNDDELKNRFFQSIVYENKMKSNERVFQTSTKNNLNRSI
jgi:hypothetical protein